MRPDLADLYSTPFGLIFAITAVDLLLEATCFNRPVSRRLGVAAEPARVDFTCTAHFVPDGNLATRSAAPLLPLEVATLAPRLRND